MPVSFGELSDVKEQVRQAIDIVDLVGSYLELRPQGADYVAHCPWHDDQRPSLRVSRRRQAWRCWVCNIGGDIFSFVMRRENVGFREALEMLADRAGISLPRSGPTSVPGSPTDKNALYRACAWAELQYHDCLMRAAEAEPARQYLARRGIDDSSLKRYRLGFSPSGWWIVERAKESGISTALLEAVGVLARSERTGGYYDRFRDRVIFPIHDAQGRTLAFGGRILPERAQEQTAKYVNCPETRLYSKSETLFGLDVVRDRLARSRHVFVMEGYTDAIMAVQHGIEEAVAVCGTALGTRHLNVLRRYAEHVTLVLDGDEAGKRRANELLALFFAAAIDVRILTLPDGLDPCDFLLQRGAEAFRQLAQAAPDAIQHKIRLETEGIDLVRETHRAHGALERILQTLALLPVDDPGSALVLRCEQAVSRLARQFGVRESSVRVRLEQLRAARRQRPGPTAHSPGSSVHQPEQPRPAYRDLPAWDRELLELLAIEPTLIAEAADKIPPEALTSPQAQTIYRACLARWEQGGAFDFAGVLADLTDEQLQNLWVALAEAAEQKLARGHQTPQQSFRQLTAALDRAAATRQRRTLLEALSSGDEQHALDQLAALYELARHSKAQDNS